MNTQPSFYILTKRESRKINGGSMIITLGMLLAKSFKVWA